MAMRQPVSIPQTEISKQTEIKVTVGQPSYLLSGYPKSPPNQLQVNFSLMVKIDPYLVTH